MKDEVETQDTSGLSQAEYVDAIMNFLAPHVENALKALPPPDNRTTTGVAAFIQAFVQFGLSVTTAMGIQSFEYARALQVMAADIEAKCVQRLSEMIKEKRAEAPSSPAAEARIDF